MATGSIRIGCASGFLGDTSVAAPQLIKGGKLDFLVFDYLAEVTMSILARAKAKRPDQGYAHEFVTVVMRECLRDIAAQKIKVVTNAGGQNPAACAAHLTKLAESLGLTLKIAVVAGDDVMDRVPDFAARGITEMFSGQPFPTTVMSANAYLGGFGIARALDLGADIVITGRVVDSALALGPLIHAFGWRADEYDKLSQGSLAGHVIECGAQATGGLHTDWQDVPDWAHIGYPIVECFPDGRFIVSKPSGTGGLVTCATVGEQILYEIGDPQAYLLPDVACDFSAVKLAQVGPEEVEVTGATGLPPTSTYKVCLTFQDGYRASGVLPVVGIDARAKAIRQAEAVLIRTREMFRDRNMGDYRQTLIEPLGAEALYGANSRAMDVREVICKIAVEHEDEKALEIFAREFAAPVTSMSPGSTGWMGGRPTVAPIVKLFSFALPKTEVAMTVTFNGTDEVVPVPTNGGFDTKAIKRPPVPADPAAEAGMVSVPLIRLAWARSGDKGDKGNVGIIARDPAFLPYIRMALTPETVMAYMAHHFAGGKNPKVERFELPGFLALNFLLHDALGGGGMASMRLDPLAKSMAQQMLDMPVSVPERLLKNAGPARAA